MAPPETSEKHRVQKLLSAYGHCSRRKAEELIAAGKVTVNGAVITLGDQASEEDVIAVDGRVVERQQHLYVALHKPVGCVTAVTDKHERTVMEYLDFKERLFPVGRLDKETSGLLLLTNDGDWANELTHPSKETKKVYEAELDKPIRDSEIKKLTRGIELEDGMTAPAKAKRLGLQKVELEIHEGKNRIVRRMFEALGYKVEKLHRTRVGKYTLGTLKPGRYVFVKP